MAAVTSLGSTFNTTAGAHTVTATPAVDDLIVVAAQAGRTTDDTTGTVTDDQTGGTYDFIGRFWDAAIDRWVAFYIRTALIGSAVSTIFTATPSGTTVGGGLQVFAVTGMSRVGADAELQNAGDGNGGAGTTPTATLGAAATTTNALIGIVTNGANPASITPRSSPVWTERLDTGFATPTTGIETMSIDSGETASAIAWGAASATTWSCMVIELDTSSAAVTLPPRPTIVNTAVDRSYSW